MNLTDPITNIPGVGDSFQKRLTKLEISTVSDLLNHFPVRYLDYQKTTPISNLTPNEPACIKATLTKFASIKIRGNRSIQKATIADLTGTLNLTWFNQPYLKDTFHLNEQYFFTGSVDLFNNKLTLNAPDFEPVKNEQLHTNRIIPVYALTAGITQKWLRHKVHAALNTTIIPEILSIPGFLSLKDSYQQIHFPTTQKSLTSAKKRLSFNDLLAINLKSELTKITWQSHSSTPILINQDLHQKLIKALPFTLTADQSLTINHIFTDLALDKPMNRLVQGDVGSGKTIVAIASALQVLNSNLNVIILAPTQVLAEQHHQTFSKILKPFKINPHLITSNKKAEIIENKSNIYIGTHALLHQTKLLSLENLGLVIVDEQHRFGVLQRTHFLKNKHLPHSLTMSATPIPRTIALSLYGHLDISNIKTLPQNRKRIKTWVVPETKRIKAYDWVKKELNQGRQTFVICPLIEESEHDTLKNVAAVTTMYENLKKVFSTYKLALLHGKMKPQEKEQILADFKAKKYDLLVSTPVIEVGIDIPNANIIIIEGSERFGLASLHQLRGRVGRGNEQSYCLLFCSNTESSTLSRLKILEKYHNGLIIARLDLRIRGAGEIFGTSQSGHLDTQFKEFWNKDLASKAQALAKNLVTNKEKAQQILTKLNPQLAKMTSPN